MTAETTKPWTERGQSNPAGGACSVAHMEVEQIRLEDRWSTFFATSNNSALDLLRSSIRDDGIRDPLVVTQDDVLVDGHRRLTVARELGLDRVPVDQRQFADEREIEEFILTVNLQRRNLTEAQRRYFIGRLYNTRKGDRAANLKKGADSPKDQDDPSEKSTAEKVAEQCGVGPATVKRYARCAAAIDKVTEVLGIEGRNRVLTGKITNNLVAAVEAATGVEEMMAAIDGRGSQNGSPRPRSRPRPQGQDNDVAAKLEVAATAAEVEEAICGEATGSEEECSATEVLPLNSAQIVSAPLGQPEKVPSSDADTAVSSADAPVAPAPDHVEAAVAWDVGRGWRPKLHGLQKELTSDWRNTANAGKIASLLESLGMVVEHYFAMCDKEAVPGEELQRWMGTVTSAMQGFQDILAARS